MASKKVLPVKTVSVGTQMPAHKVWTWDTLAPDWFADALREAPDPDPNARRREILFSVCTVEAYLPEWVRDEVFPERFAKIRSNYFPKGRPGIRDHWKDVVERLRDEGFIPEAPDFGDMKSGWWKFRKLVDYRNALVHAEKSLPRMANEKPSRMPLTLDKLPPGWAVQIVVTLIQKLHSAVGTTAPTWLHT